MTQETSTREQAIAWWNTLSKLQQTQICDCNTEIVGKIRRRETLTGREIELLYKQENPLTDEQIKSWRQIIMMRLESVYPGTGIYASIMPKQEVITFYRKTKQMLETAPEVVKAKEQEIVYKPKPKCTHSNFIKGANGKYCLDCERYV